MRTVAMKNTRARTGCRTCRVRKIKCDEERPSCQRCASTGRRCDGYELLGPSARDATEKLKGKRNLQPRSSSSCTQNDLLHQRVNHNISQVLSFVECESFRFFRSHTAQEIPGCFGSSIWEQLVLQLSHNEPCILHAAIAVGAMHRFSRAKCPTLEPNSFFEPSQTFAIKQYVKSLNHLRKRLDGQADHSATHVALVTCLLFICLEMLQGNRVGALVHLRTGLRILCCSRSLDVEIGNRRDSEALTVRLSSYDGESIICQIARSFARLDYDSTMFGERSPALTFVRHDNQLPSPMIIPRRFATIAEARGCLDFLANAVFSFRGKLLQLVSTKVDNQDTSYGSDLVSQVCMYHACARTTELKPFLKMTEEIAELKSDLEAWMGAFKLLSREALYSYSLPVIFLEVQHFYIFFLISTCRDTHETICDNFDDHFRRVVQLAGRFINNIQSTDPSSSLPCLTFTLESGIIPSLYLVALKCRTQSIRQEAITLLYKSRCQEGMWESSLIARFVAEISRLEYERACALEESSESASRVIPEAARFTDILLALTETPGVARLVCARYLHEVMGDIEISDFVFKL